MKKAYVLNLTWKNSLVDLQRYAEVPPGRALLVPAPDSEAPDDLSLPRAPQEETSQASDADLPDLWARAKSKIWHYEIQDYQLRKWFEKNFNIAVSLEDFEPPVPPEKDPPGRRGRAPDDLRRAERRGRNHDDADRRGRARLRPPGLSASDRPQRTPRAKS